MKCNSVTIERTGKIVNIKEDDLRKGDILLLQSGDIVPADVRLVESRGLQVDEFDLTGEIRLVDKIVVDGENVFVYKGSRVVRGWGKGVVVALGEETEFGKILNQRFGQVKYVFPSLIRKRYIVLLVFLLPPFIVSFMRYGNLMHVCVIFLTVVVFAVLMQNGDLFKYVVTLNEIRKIKRQNIHVNDETSLERVNDVNVMCFDKTGVLTTRDIRVKRIYFAEEILGVNSVSHGNFVWDLVNIACVLANDVVFLEKMNQADPIDKAFMNFALNNGVDIDDVASRYNRVYEKPFDSEDRYMACGFKVGDGRIYFAKGDPEIILRMCMDFLAASGEVNKIGLEFLFGVIQKTYSINQNGDIAIALAYNCSSLENLPSQFTFLCLLQLENPAKLEALKVVARLKEKGIRSVLLTGDRPETAVKIAREIGLDDKQDYCLTGKSMEKMDLSEIARQSDYVSVFARLSPSQKQFLSGRCSREIIVWPWLATVQMTLWLLR